MRGALRHPLVARLLGIVAAVVSARAGIGHSHGLAASQLRVDSFWTPRYSYPAAGRSNGSARVRRAAQKARLLELVRELFDRVEQLEQREASRG